MSASRNTLHRIVLGWTLTVLVTACSGSEAVGPDPQPTDNINGYLASVSTWPTQPADEGALPTADPTETRAIVDTVRVVDDNGNVTFNFGVEFVCTETPYSIRQTPEKIVMFSPDRDILFAGSLLQGRSHRESSGAPGSLLSLPIAQRAPIQVSIPGLPTGDNFRNVPEVTQANVESAIGAIIGNAQAQELFTPATDDFEVETYNSEREFALKTRISGRYLGFRGSAGVDVNTRSSETTIAVRYIQRLYEVVVAPPQTPAGMFSTALTQEILDQQIGLNRLGPDNQPVYISNVVYGRMMMFTMTAQASAEELKAIVNASYDGLVGGVSASLSARQQQVVSSSRIAITTYGGDRNGTQAMIRSGDWREYFTQTVRLSDALPLSYTFKTLTGQIAGVSESTNYVIKSCQPLANTPFEFRSVHQIGSPVPTPYVRRLADVTGDGRQDLVLVHLSATQNQVAVLPGLANGSFGAPVVTSAPETPAGGWASFQILLGDVTGEGNADLVFSRQSSGGNLNYVALGSASGALTFGPVQTVGPASWSTSYTAHLADLNGDGAKDLVWNLLTTVNATWRALSNGDGTFNMAAAASQTHPNSGWGTYVAFIGDVDADGDEDITWNSTAESNNRFYHGISGGTGAFSFAAFRDHPTVCCWTSAYKRISGDFDGDQRMDVVLWFSSAQTRGLHRAYSNGAGSFSFGTFASNDAWRAAIPHATNWEPYAADVNGDGVDDVVLNSLGNTNRVRLILGTVDRTFATPLLQPEHPASAQWTSAGTRGALVGDVNGDGRADIVWVVPGAVSEVYVALGRP